MENLIFGLGGFEWAALGAAMAAIGGGCGSAMGITYVARIAAGIMTEDPNKFGRLLVIVALPGTQGIYGFISVILVIVFFILLGGGGADIVPQQGFEVFIACLPITVIGFVSGIFQGLTSVASASLVGKREEEMGKAIVLPAMVETYAVLALIVTIFLLMVARASF